MTWPWPDDRLERRTRIALMYRDRLAAVDPQACAELDEVMVALAQFWIIGGQAIDPETLCTAAQIAEYADVSESTVYSWISRWPLQAQKIRARDGRQVYRWGDVIARQQEQKQKEAR